MIFFPHVLADNWANDPTLNKKIFDAKDVIGTITNPLNKYGSVDQTGGGLGLLINNILRLVFVFAGIYAFVNLIIAGYQYMSAGGDTKLLAAAWARIWQSLIGLVIIVGSFALAALFGALFFGDATFMLTPQVFGPIVNPPR